MLPKTRWDGSIHGEPDPNQHANLIRLADWGPRPVDWLWRPFLPRRKVTLLVGEPEMGKTFFALDLAARLSRGDVLPPDSPLGGPADTLILTGDDDLDDTIYTRLTGLDADLGRIYVLTNSGPRGMAEGARQISLGRSVEALSRAAKQMPKCRLIVIDPITAFIAGMSASSHEQVRNLLQRLTMLAKVNDAAVLIVTHNRKEGGRSALHRTIGSLAFTLASRVVLTLVPDPEELGRRLLLPAKMNLLPRSECLGRAFTLRESGLDWDPEPVTIRPDELQDLVARGTATSERVLEVSEGLCEFLMEGSKPSQEVLSWAERERVPRWLLYEAKTYAGIASTREPGKKGWYWVWNQEESC